LGRQWLESRNTLQQRSCEIMLLPIRTARRREHYCLDHRGRRCFVFG